MKRRLDPWVLLMDWGLILLAVYGAVFCLADSFGVTPPTDLLWTGAALCLVLLHLAEMDSLGRNYTAPLSDGEPLPLTRLFLKGPAREAGFRIRRRSP